jgi:hypothetical protein
MNNLLRNVCKSGVYYNPAIKHYGSICNITCDNCKKTKLDVCIGWDNYDLCLPCVDDINKEINSPGEDINKKEQNPIEPSVSKMLQNQFGSCVDDINKEINSPGEDINKKEQNPIELSVSKMLQNQFALSTPKILRRQKNYFDDIPIRMEQKQYKSPCNLL